MGVGIQDSLYAHLFEMYLNFYLPYCGTICTHIVDYGEQLSTFGRVSQSGMCPHLCPSTSVSVHICVRPHLYLCHVDYQHILYSVPLLSDIMYR